MSALTQIRVLWRHAAWADAAILAALRAAAEPPPAALREYAHVLGADEVWLSRVEQRPSRSAVWPEIGLEEVESLARAVREGYETLLARLSEGDLESPVTYTNSAGASFVNELGDILLHVALHAQYHRGKVNLMLRQAGLAPVPSDYIAFVRGAPAATEASAREARAAGA